MEHFKLKLAFCLFSILIPPLAAQTGSILPGNAENANREAVKTILVERNIPFEERSLFAEYGGFGSSLLVSLPAGGTAGDAAPENFPPSFVLAIPLAGNKGAELPLRFASALEFIKRVQTSGQENRGFIVAFLGDEGSLLPPELQKRPHSGFDDLCGILEEPENAFFMFLDMPDAASANPGAAGKLSFQYRSAEGVTSLGALKNISGLCTDMNIPWSLAGSNFLSYGETGFSGGSPLLAYAHAQGLDAVQADISGIAPDDLGEFLFRYAASLDAGKSRDRRYVIISLPGTAPIFLSGPLLVFTFLAGGAALIVAAIFFAFHPKVFSKRRLVSVCAAVLIIAGMYISVYFDIRLLPLWAPPFFFVLLALILHRPVSIVICTILAYVSLGAVGGFLYSRRMLPPLNTGAEVREQIAPMPAEGESLMVDIKSRRQFNTNFGPDRLILNLSLLSAENPVRFDLSLISEPESAGSDPLLIHYAPMPYRIDERTRSVEFFLGEGPPNPMELEIILSGDFSGELRAEALYFTVDEAYVQRAVREIPITR
ncbi:hypothetical protein FACS189485_19680 [Spirochaetia bacterium]|nr:hypothetical protein FACS189485_19680 [Spirochaetia bacterium]